MRIDPQTRSRPLGFFRDTRGGNLVEYIIILGVVAIFALGAFRIFGKKVAAKIGQQGVVVASLDDETDNGGGGGGGGGGGCIGGLCTNGNCFVAGTQVVTLEGDRPIEQLHVGDVVLTRDETTRALEPHRVIETFVTPEMPIVAVRVHEDANETIEATPGHRFWTEDRGWVEAAMLHVGEALLAVDGRALHVESVALEPSLRTVYNVEIEGTHTYFVGATHVLVHNPNGPGGCGGNGGAGGGNGAGGSGGSGGGAGGGGSGGSGGGAGGGGAGGSGGGSGGSGGGAGGGGSGGSGGANGSGGSGGSGSTVAAAPPKRNGDWSGAATSPAGTVYSVRPEQTNDPVPISPEATKIAAKGPSADPSAQGTVQIGNKTKKTVTIDGATYVGGDTYKNLDGALPKNDANGKPITYTEWDTKPYTGANRGDLRVVHGSDGRDYYTDNHYKKFTQM